MLGRSDAPRPAGAPPDARIVVTPLPGTDGHRLHWVDGDARPLSFAAVLEKWRQPSGARAMTAALIALPQPAVFWECPALTRHTVAEPFECVARPAPQLAARRETADRASFARAWAVDDGTPYAAFDNLGGDARLIAPRPAALDRTTDPRDLLAFLRSAPPPLADALWARIADEAVAHGASGPLWISTSGLGVAWLHVRLDRAPKYYGHRPYIRA